MTRKTAAEIKADAVLLVPDNHVRSVSPMDVRGRLEDIADSMATKDADGRVVENTVFAPFAVEEFAEGVGQGDESTDATAFAAAVAEINSQGGGGIKFREGQTYLSHNRSWTLSKSLKIEGNGATLKRPDGVLTGNNQEIWLPTLSTADAALEIDGLTIDANFTGNPTPPDWTFSDWEQNSSIRAVVSAGVTARHIRFRNMRLLDRYNFDHLRVIATGTAKLQFLEFDNIVSDDGNDATLRADLIWYAGVLKTLIKNCSVRRIETEYTNPPTERVLIRIQDTDVTELDLGGTGGTASLIDLFLENVRADDTTIVYASCWDRFCDFGDIQDWRVATWRSWYSTYRVPDTGMPMGSTTSGGFDIDWRVEYPKFRLVDGPQTPGNRALALPTITTSFTPAHQMTFIEPDFDDDFSRIGVPSGNFTCIGGKFKCLEDTETPTATAGKAWLLNGIANRVKNITLDGGDYTDVDTAQLEFDNWDIADGHHLRLSGEAKGNLAVTVANGTPAAANVTSDRVIIAASDPADGYYGDTLKVRPLPAAGSPLEKINTSLTATPAWETTITRPA